MMGIDFLNKMAAGVRLADESIAPLAAVALDKRWADERMNTAVTNTSDQPMRIKEIVLFSGELPLSPDTLFYGEGFQMLAQYAGTLSNPRLIGAYGTDWDFFRIPKMKFNEDLWTVYNLLELMPQNEDGILMAFASRNRFSGEFRFKGSYLEIVMDTEDLTLEPGQTWELEQFIFLTGPDRNRIYEQLAEAINRNHPRRPIMKFRPGGAPIIAFVR